MLGQFLICRVDVGVVTTGLGDAGLKVARYEDGADSAVVAKGPDGQDSHEAVPDPARRRRRCSYTPQEWRQKSGQC